MPSVNDIQYRTPDQPRQLRLDTVGNKCNAKCLSCHRWLSKRKGCMDFSLISDILDDIAKWERPLAEIIPVNYGEFFLREDWFEILAMINVKSPATKIVIPTNGALLNADKIRNLAKIPSIRIINFSVNAYFDETYEAFTGLKADTIPKIRQAVAMLKILRPDITLWASMVFSHEYQTDFERDEFYKYWIGHAWPQILTASSAGRKGVKPIIPVKLPCQSIFSDIVIGYDGRLSSCCFDANFSMDLGDYTGDLKKDWGNEALTELRKLHNEHRRDEVGLCRDCTFA